VSRGRASEWEHAAHRPPQSQTAGLGLFDQPSDPEEETRSRRTAPTSVAAGRKIQSKAAGLRLTIANVIDAAGARGVTRKEIAETAAISKDTVNARVRELLDEQPPRYCVCGERGAEGVIINLRHHFERCSIVDSERRASA
jgi:DNA-directed RNA polymerase specialized sigma24 family protein